MVANPGDPFEELPTSLKVLCSPFCDAYTYHFAEANP